MKIVLAGGGTGGHLYPAIALAEAVERRGGQVLFVTGNKAIEDRVFQTLPFRRERLAVGGIATVNGWQQLLSLLKIIPATWRSLKLLRQECPDFVTLTGGYVAFPVGLASLLLGKPLVLVEPNAIAGRVTRLLRRFAQVVVSLAAQTGGIAAKTIFGVPVRQSIIQAAARSQASNPGKLRVLVLGGSQGARSLNQALPQLPSIKHLEVFHIGGPGQRAQVLADYAAQQIQATVVDYVDNIAEIYGWADFAIARCGAGTISELLAVGLPAVLVPYPYAADAHQDANAQIYVNAGGGVIVREGDRFVERLDQAVQAMCDHSQRRQYAAALANAKKNFDPDQLLVAVEQAL